jgi:L-asparaginase
MHHNIKLIITGGTIAKKYDELTGELVFDDSHIEKMLKQGRCKTKLELTSLMLKDSLEMNDNDRDEIFNTCKTTTYDRVLITHGTDTMVASAKKLSSIKDKTIVLTGAMIPYAFKNSDAVFNLGFALSAVQALPCGVYICINGEIFNWDKVTKNTKEGYFEKTF